MGPSVHRGLGSIGGLLPSPVFGRIAWLLVHCHALHRHFKLELRTCHGEALGGRVNRSRRGYALRLRVDHPGRALNPPRLAGYRSLTAVGSRPGVRCRVRPGTAFSKPWSGSLDPPSCSQTEERTTIRRNPHTWRILLTEPCSTQREGESRAADEASRGQGPATRPTEYTR